MSIRPTTGLSRPGHPPAQERIQREHELAKALGATRHLQALLEMIGDRPDDVRWVRQLRDDLAQEITGLGRDSMPGVLDDADSTSGNEP